MSGDDLRPPFNVPYAAAEILVAGATIVGNSMVLVVFKRERRLRLRRTNYYIVSLAVADLLVGCVGIPCAILSSVGLPKNLHTCLFSISLLMVLCTISIFSLVAVSVDRYWAILHPMSYSRNMNSRLAFRIICVCWLAGSLVGFLPLFGWNAGPNNPPVCRFTQVMDYNYLVFLYFATIIFPALLLAGFYAHIYGVILKQLRQMTHMDHTATYNTSGGIPTSIKILAESRKKEVQATQNLSIIVFFFILCWIPLYTINCVQAFCPHCKVPPILVDFCIILSHLNSFGNPLLYAYRLRDFRGAFKRLLCREEQTTIPPARNFVSVTGFHFAKNAKKLFVFDDETDHRDGEAKLKSVKNTDVESPYTEGSHSYVKREEIGGGGGGENEGMVYHNPAYVRNYTANPRIRVTFDGEISPDNNSYRVTEESKIDSFSCCM